VKRAFQFGETGAGSFAERAAPMAAHVLKRAQRTVVAAHDQY
jgi:hypothetical protein